MRINKHDTQGTKPLLGKGELGYDDYTAGGDVGRVYVGTGTENIALAEKLEVDSHVSKVNNPHSVTKAQVGLGNVDNTSDVNKPISTATQTELDLKANRIDVDDLFTDASNLEYDDTFTDMRVADVQAALAHLGEESKYWSNIHSAVRLFGGIIQDNGDGTVRVANGGGLFKKEASSVEGVPAGECEPMQLNAAQGGKLFYETWEATENVQLTNNAYNYIFIVWDHTFDNGDGSFGKARVIASTNFYLQDWESEISYYNFKAAHPELTLPARRSGMLHGFTVGRVYKMDNEITIRVCGTNGWNFNKRVQLFGEEFFPVIRARGLDIQTIPNTLQFNVTEGVMWAEMANRFTVRAFEMDKGDTFTSWYQHTAETTALTLAQIQSTYPTGIANRKYDILYSSTDTKYYRLNPSNNTWGEVLDYINSKVNISTHPANLSVLETLAPTGYVNNSEGTDYVVLQLQATDSFYRYNPNAALGNRWELFGDKSTVHPYVAVAFLGDVAGMNAEYPTGFNDVINVIVGCADGMYYEYSGVSGQSGWKRVQGYIERNGWLRFYKQSAVDALRYNDSTNNKLVDLENGMYGVAWIYMVHDNSCHVVYGQGAYTSEEAKQAALPSPLPGILAAYSTLVGKMTFSRGATTFENAESPFIEKFISSGVSLHNDLAGLDGGNSTQNKYYHLDELAYNLVNTFIDVVDVSPEGDLGIVGDYSGANALFSGNLTVGGTTSGITKAMVGLANAENTADNVKNVLSATKLTTTRNIALTGDVTGNINFDGSANVSIATTIAANSVALGTDTTGNYVAGVTAGTGITVSGTASEGWSPTVSITNIGTVGTYTKVTTNAQGQVTSGTSLAATDIPDLDASKITSGTIDAARLPSYVDDVLEFSDLASFPATGVSGKIYVALDTNKTYRWSGSVYVYITSGAVDSVNGQTGVVNITTITGNSGTATKLQTARTIGGVSFDGSANINLPGVNTAGNQNTTGNAATATTLQTARTIGASGDVTGTATSFNGSVNITIPMTLANSGVTAGTYSKVTVDAKGRVTAGATQTMEDIPDATFKRSVRCATTANITLSGTQTIDGIAVVAGNRVLVKDQTTSSQNGIYVVNASTWTRSLDADTSSKIASALVAVDSGTVNGGKLFDNDFKTTDTLGTTAMTWSMNLDNGSLLTAGSTAIGMIQYNGTTAAAGQFDGGTTTPTGTTRLNYGGYFYPTFLNLLGSGDTTTASSHVFVETGSDGYVRPKTLANFKTEIFASPTLVTPNIGVATGTSFNSITGLSSIAPLVAGTATIGTSTEVARADHIHPVQTSVTGNAGTATKLETARTINGVNFDGTANIVINPRYFSSGVGTSGITVSTNYALFPAANDTITLAVGVYRVGIMASVTVATATVSGTLLLNPRGAGTAVGTIYGVTSSTITNGGASNQFFTSSTALGTAFTVSAASAVAGRVYIVYGEYIVNVTTAGTFIPAYQFSATLTSGVVTLNAGNNIIIDNITNTSVTTFGGWN